MSLAALSISHHSTPLDVREQFALSEAGRERLTRGLEEAPEIEEFLLLATCNRIEIYANGSDYALERLKECFCAAREVEPSYLAQYAHTYRHADVCEHLFCVAAGLDSQMVGETEILGQVKQAYAEATEAGHTGPQLNRLFQKSFQCAKWIRTHTEIGKGQISIGNIGAELAMRIFGDLKHSRILLIGTGEVGEKALEAIRSRGGGTVTVSSRTLGKARLLAAKHQGVAVDFEHFHSIVQYFDIVICATSAIHPVLSEEVVRRALRERPDEPIFLIDLAMPRDVEAACGKLTNAFLYNLDDLAAIANENLKARRKEINRCRDEIAVRAKRNWEDLSSRAEESDQSASSQSAGEH